MRSVAANAGSASFQLFPSSKRNYQDPLRSSGCGAATTPTAATSAAKNTFFFILIPFSSLFYGTQIAELPRSLSTIAQMQQSLHTFSAVSIMSMIV